jgi:hypothetical protein
MHPDDCKEIVVRIPPQSLALNLWHGLDLTNFNVQDGRIHNLAGAGVDDLLYETSRVVYLYGAVNAA